MGSILAQEPSLLKISQGRVYSSFPKPLSPNMFGSTLELLQYLMCIRYDLANSGASRSSWTPMGNGVRPVESPCNISKHWDRLWSSCATSCSVLGKAWALWDIGEEKERKRGGDPTFSSNPSLPYSYCVPWPQRTEVLNRAEQKPP